MKRLVLLLSAVALSACSGTTSNTTSTASGSTGHSTTSASTTTSSTTTGTTTSGSTSRGTTSGGSTGLATAASSGSTGLATAASSGSTGGSTAGSSGSTGITTTGGSGSTGSCAQLPVTGTPPANDNCSAPETIALNSTAQGDTTFAQNDFAYPTSAASCTGFRNGGPDVVYAFSPTAAGDYTVTVTPTSLADGGTWDPAIYLLTSCPTSCSLTPACPVGADNSGRGGAEAFSFAAAASSSNFIVVDRYSATSFSSPLGGPFTISVTPYVDAGAPPPFDAGPPPAPQVNDNCASLDAGLDLVLAPSPDGGQFAAVAFDTTSYNDDSQTTAGGQCGSTRHGFGNDEVFHLHLAGPVPSLTASITPGRATYTPIVYIHTSPCQDMVTSVDGGPSSEIACAFYRDGGSPAAVATNVPAGDYYIWADGYGSQGPGTLTVTVP